MRHQEAGRDGKPQVQGGAPPPRHSGDAPPVGELEERDTRPFRGRKQRELSRRKLLPLDDPPEGEPPGLPSRMLLDRDYGREDRSSRDSGRTS